MDHRDTPGAGTLFEAFIQAWTRAEHGMTVLTAAREAFHADPLAERFPSSEPAAALRAVAQEAMAAGGSERVLMLGLLRVLDHQMQHACEMDLDAAVARTNEMIDRYMIEHVDTAAEWDLRIQQRQRFQVGAVLRAQQLAAPAWRSFRESFSDEHVLSLERRLFRSGAPGPWWRRQSDR